MKLLMNTGTIMGSRAEDRAWENSLLDHGSALARGRITEIIRTIHERAQAGSLNRGFRLSLPYWDNRRLQMRLYDVQIIPGGRSGFLPVFVVIGCQEEIEKLRRISRMSPEIRQQLIDALETIAAAFNEYEQAG